MTHTWPAERAEGEGEVKGELREWRGKTCSSEERVLDGGKSEQGDERRSALECVLVSALDAVVVVDL